MFCKKCVISTKKIKRVCSAETCNVVDGGCI
nr:MAG TPA: hypothetical protein [Caudoviricetes sp.]